MHRKKFTDRPEHPLARKLGRKGGFLVMGLFILAGIAAVGWLVMLLWNWLMPALFTGAQQIDYWHGLGLLVLCKILFGGLGGHGWRGRREMWAHMSSEEREQMRQQFKGRWGGRFGAGPSVDSGADKKEGAQEP